MRQTRIAAGTGDQHVDATISGNRGGHRGVDRGFIGDVDRHDRGATAGGNNCVGHDLRILMIDVEQRDGCPLGCKVARGFRAYALRRAGDGNNA